MLKKTSILAFFLIFLNLNLFAQLVEGLPVENGKIGLAEVVKVEGKSSQELYTNAQAYFADNYKSAQDVIQAKDQEAKMIIGKAFTNIHVSGGMANNVKMQMWFTVRIECKEGRYRYQIYDLGFKGYPNKYNLNPQTTPAEAVFDKKSYYKRNGKPRPLNVSYKEEMLEGLEGLKSMITNAMKAESNSGLDNTDDW